jgi:hypothetical protein
VATNAVRGDVGRGAAVGAAAIAQGILGLEFLLGGLNKYLDTNFAGGFKTFVVASVGAQNSVPSPIVQTLILPNAALFAELARFTELAGGIALLVATAGVRVDSHTRGGWVLALTGLVAAVALGGLSLTIYVLKGGVFPGVDTRLALAPPMQVEVVNVLLAGAVAWLQAGRLLAARTNGMAWASRLHPKTLVGLIVIVANLLGVAACIGTATAGPPSGAITVTMTDYRFTPGNLELKSGDATFYLVNSGGQQHDMVIADAEGKVMASIRPSAPRACKSCGCHFRARGRTRWRRGSWALVGARCWITCSSSALATWRR